MGCSPSLSLSSCSYSFPLYFTQRASQATFTSSRSHSLNFSSIYPFPLTSSPPHLATLHLCSSFIPAAGLGHSVLCVGLVDFFSLRLFLSSVRLSFFSLRSYPTLLLFPPKSSHFAQSPFLSVLFFQIFFSLSLLLLTSKQKAVHHQQQFIIDTFTIGCFFIMEFS